MNDAQQLLSDLAASPCVCSGHAALCFPCRARAAGMPLRPSVTDMYHKVAQLRVQQKLKERLEKRGKHAFISTHEIYGIVAEEFKELGDALQANDREAFVSELVDICVGALHGIASHYSGALEW